MMPESQYIEARNGGYYAKGSRIPLSIQIPSTRSIGEAIEGLLLIWLFLNPAESRNQVTWLP